jgi:hypothetical protein
VASSQHKPPTFHDCSSLPPNHEDETLPESFCLLTYKKATGIGMVILLAWWIRRHVGDSQMRIGEARTPVISRQVFGLVSRNRIVFDIQEVIDDIATLIYPVVAQYLFLAAYSW